MFNSDDEHFSDASEGHQRLNSQVSSGRASPIPRTRVEKVDDSARYGEIPGTPEYEKRGQDAVPDEIEILSQGSRSRSHSIGVTRERPLTPGGTPIPRTVVEMIDPSEPSYGEIPGTRAYRQREEDAVPDAVLKTSSSLKSLPFVSSPDESGPAPAVPETLLSRVDSIPDTGVTSRPTAHKRHPSDALPDAVERISDSIGKLFNSQSLI